MSHFDVIVIGLGGMGTAACWQLARQGADVLGLEQFGPAHELGSSHGQTRIIRTAYFEHPAYVPLVRASFQGWYDLEQVTGQTLLRECPCLTLGPPEGELVAGVLRAAEEHQLPIERLSRGELRQRYPQFQPPEGLVAVLERSAGILQVEACVRAHAQAARERNALLRYNEPVLDWQADGSMVRVTTREGTYQADRLVITAGPWARAALASAVALPLTVMRQVAFWFGADLTPFRRDLFPVFIAETPEGAFYGLPAVDPAGVKVARHYGASELPDPESVNRNVAYGEEGPVRDFLRSYLPAAAEAPVSRSSICLYTLTPDRHFIVDTVPGQPNVAVAAGFSGHGFKFATVIGAILADLALRGQTDWPIDLFRIRRFATKAV